MANDCFRQPAPGLIKKKISDLGLGFIVLSGAFSHTCPASLAQSPSLTAVKSKTAHSQPAKGSSTLTTNASPVAVGSKAPLSEETKHIIRARSMAAEGHYDDSCSELRGVLEKNPKSVEALFFLGYVFGPPR